MVKRLPVCVILLLHFCQGVTASLSISRDQTYMIKDEPSDIGGSKNEPQKGQSSFFARLFPKTKSDDPNENDQNGEKTEPKKVTKDKGKEAKAKNNVDLEGDDIVISPREQRLAEKKERELKKKEAQEKRQQERMERQKQVEEERHIRKQMGKKKSDDDLSRQNEKADEKNGNIEEEDDDVEEEEDELLENIDSTLEGDETPDIHSSDKENTDSTPTDKASQMSPKPTPRHGLTGDQPALIFWGASTPPGHPPSMPVRPGPPRSPESGNMSPNQLLAASAVASLINIVAKLWIVFWVAKRLAWEEETISPVQHFIWECLNDRYTKDDEILARAMLSTPPSGISRRRWCKHVQSMTQGTNNKSIFGPRIPLPTKTVVVVDVTPHNHLDLTYLSDVVNFLVSVHATQRLGIDPEVVLLIQSPGGSVTTYGLAAAQVARLQQVGLNVTVCVDSIAASGGYMMASQSSQIIAAPFAWVGSIGVMQETLNFHKLLTDYGIKPLSLKAGENKNSLSMLGPISEKEIREETTKLERVHKSFIDQCKDHRPGLDLSFCDGSIWSGTDAMNGGLVDRILTSDEYIWEKINEGAYVLKLHKSSGRASGQFFFARALDILPHLRQVVTNRAKGVFENVPMNVLTNRAMQVAMFAAMVSRRIKKDLDL